MTSLRHPAVEIYMGLPGYLLAWIILILSLSLFFYVLYKRYLLIKSGQPDPRFSHTLKRMFDLVIYGLIQIRQPRYLWAGVIHIMIFWGFIVLGLRSLDLVTQGLNLPIFLSLMQTGFGAFYNILKDIFELIVLAACIWAILRRALVKHERYEGSDAFEAYLVLSLISFLMITDMFYEGSYLLLTESEGKFLPASRLTALVLQGTSPCLLRITHILSYWLHILTFFFFLNLLPLSKHFHIITAIPNVFFRKLSKGSLKPAAWGVENPEDLETLGIGEFSDFTWKHILDFYSCTECGRCSDNCPAYAVGRPLSPKMLTLKLRNHGYNKLPVFKGRKKGEKVSDDLQITGGLISYDEIWSCTTCGACEEECPVFVEYIDKIIDMRRHLIETSQNPGTFNQVLMHFEKTGNPFGKPAAKRTEWVKEIPDIPVRLLNKGDEGDVLYFVDSYGSYDPKAQSIAHAIVKGLHLTGIDFGILGTLEKDSGHQVRRMGEEGLFQLLVEENMEVFNDIRFKQIITTDPHALNTLKHDYPASFKVLHYSQFFLPFIKSGRLKPSKPLQGRYRYTYHDPCYLGRHNGIYDDPRKMLCSLPGLKLVEMEKSRDKSFCCGGGDIALWHEIEKEEMRISEKRIHMAREVKADIVVTACPFCLIHLDDAIKTAGFEDEMKVIDLMELFVSTL